MARPYSAGGVSIAESSQMCRVGPLLLAACGLSTTQRAYLPRMFSAPSLLFPTAPHTGFRAKERRCGGEDRPWRSSSLHSH